MSDQEAIEAARAAIAEADATIASIQQQVKGATA